MVKRKTSPGKATWAVPSRGCPWRMSLFPRQPTRSPGRGCAMPPRGEGGREAAPCSQRYSRKKPCPLVHEKSKLGGSNLYRPALKKVRRHLMYTVSREAKYLCSIIREVVFSVIILRNKGRGGVPYNESLLLWNISISIGDIVIFYLRGENIWLQGLLTLLQC